MWLCHIIEPYRETSLEWSFNKPLGFLLGPGSAVFYCLSQLHDVGTLHSVQIWFESTKRMWFQYSFQKSHFKWFLTIQSTKGPIITTFQAYTKTKIMNPAKYYTPDFWWLYSLGQLVQVPLSRRIQTNTKAMLNPPQLWVQTIESIWDKNVFAAICP